MIGRQSGLVLLATAGLCVAACTPTQVADNRQPHWGDIFKEVERGFTRAANGMRAALHWPGVKAPKVNVGANTPTSPTLPGLTLEKPQASEAAAALKQAYAVAVANERIKLLGIDPAGILDALNAYKADNLAGGDAIAQTRPDPLVRTALEWTASTTSRPKSASRD